MIVGVSCCEFLIMIMMSLGLIYCNGISVVGSIVCDVLLMMMMLKG